MKYRTLVYLAMACLMVSGGGQSLSPGVFAPNRNAMAACGESGFDDLMHARFSAGPQDLFAGKLYRFEFTLADSVATLFQLFDRPDSPGCVVGIFRGGEMQYTGSFGMANLDYGIALSDSSAFFMSGISEQISAAATGLLIMRGDLDPGARVSGYLEDWPDWASSVRVEHLWNHTSGLPDIFELMDIAGISLSNVMDIDDYMSVMYRAGGLKHRPDAQFSRTSSGYFTLVKLIERITGDPFSTFVREELLKPMGMQNSHFHDNRNRVIPNRVISYAPVIGSSATGFSGRQIPVEPPTRYRHVYLSNFQGVGPVGFYTTMKDWERWEAFLSGNLEIVSGDPELFEKLRELIIRPSMTGQPGLNYGMGLEMEMWKGLQMQGHGGSFMGFKTDVRRFPEEGIAVATFCNRADADASAINRELARLLMRAQFDSYLKPYGGIYKNEELGVSFELSVEQGTLIWNRRLDPKGRMEEEKADQWSLNSWEITFLRRPDGTVSGFSVSTGRVREMEFQKK